MQWRPNDTILAFLIWRCRSWGWSHYLYQRDIHGYSSGSNAGEPRQQTDWRDATWWWWWYVMMVIIAEIVAEWQTEQSDVEASACLNDAAWLKCSIWSDNHAANGCRSRSHCTNCEVGQECTWRSTRFQLIEQLAWCNFQLAVHCSLRPMMLQ